MYSPLASTCATAALTSSLTLWYWFARATAGTRLDPLGDRIMSRGSGGVPEGRPATPFPVQAASHDAERRLDRDAADRGWVWSKRLRRWSRGLQSVSRGVSN